MFKNKQIILTVAIAVVLASFYFLVFRPSGDTKKVSDIKNDLRNETLLLYNKGQLKEALSKLEQLDMESANDTEVKSALAFTYRALGDKKKSFDKYEEIIKYDPRNAGTHLRLGIYYRIDKNFEKSKDHLEKALEIQRNPQFLVEASKTYEALKQFDEASALLLEASKATKDKSVKNGLIKRAESLKK